MIAVRSRPSLQWKYTGRYLSFPKMASIFVTCFSDGEIGDAFIVQVITVIPYFFAFLFSGRLMKGMTCKSTMYFTFSD